MKSACFAFAFLAMLALAQGELPDALDAINPL
jgi:hypothetical protein